ncbi:hypothetical protein BofuT4_uP004930.1 [Botrytis cinerea T4]|uniref:Uncharacterized protein n=1 Tax=Botryotinia fuckeliana (strain T4) TaxID=999810 RepID=G2Y3U4_BOTF4|nr:hypothetical protein BofuT4_uP004930.1 [Botrytis cinerea T4]
MLSWLLPVRSEVIRLFNGERSRRQRSSSIEESRNEDQLKYQKDHLKLTTFEKLNTSYQIVSQLSPHNIPTKQARMISNCPQWLSGGSSTHAKKSN